MWIGNTRMQASTTFSLQPGEELTCSTPSWHRTTASVVMSVRNTAYRICRSAKEMVNGSTLLHTSRATSHTRAALRGVFSGTGRTEAEAHLRLQRKEAADEHPGAQDDGERVGVGGGRRPEHRHIAHRACRWPQNVAIRWLQVRYSPATCTPSRHVGISALQHVQIPGFSRCQRCCKVRRARCRHGPHSAASESRL